MNRVNFLVDVIFFKVLIKALFYNGMVRYKNSIVAISQHLKNQLHIEQKPQRNYTGRQ